MTGALHHYLRQAQAPNTWRTYRAQWRAFAAWCERRGCAALPAKPEMAAEYLAQRAQAGAAVASLGVTLAALRFAHITAGLHLRLDSPILTLLIRCDRGSCMILQSRSAFALPQIAMTLGQNKAGIAALLMPRHFLLRR